MSTRTSKVMEPTTCSQSKRATNCATPRYLIYSFYLQVRVEPAASSASPPFAVPEILARYSLRIISTAAAKSPSFLPPQAALGLFAQSKRVTFCATPRFSLFYHCFHKKSSAGDYFAPRFFLIFSAVSSKLISIRFKNNSLSTTSMSTVIQ